MKGVPVVTEGRRGCGYRKPGGLYLMAGRPSEACELLPVELTVCPTCGEGVKHSRGWTWIDATKLLGLPIHHGSASHAKRCPFFSDLGRSGLIWVGQAFYETPEAFMREANSMGVSRRINTVPRDLEVGKTWVLLAHMAAWPPTLSDPKGKPGIFSAFKPKKIEYVVKGDEGEEELERLRERGIEPVEVRHADDQEELADDA